MLILFSFLLSPPALILFLHFLLFHHSTQVLSDDPVAVAVRDAVAALGESNFGPVRTAVEAAIGAKLAGGHLATAMREFKRATAAAATAAAKAAEDTTPPGPPLLELVALAKGKRLLAKLLASGSALSSEQLAVLVPHVLQHIVVYCISRFADPSESEIDAFFAQSLASVFAKRTPSFEVLVRCIENIHAACMEHGAQLFALLLQVRRSRRSRCFVRVGCVNDRLRVDVRYDALRLRAWRAPLTAPPSHTHPRSRSRSRSRTHARHTCPSPAPQYAPTKAILEAMFQSGLSAPTVEGEPLTDRWFGTLSKLQQLVEE